MRIPLKTKSKKKVKSKAKLDLVGKRDREVVEKTFDGLHRLGRMSWTTTSTSFSYACFIVWENQPNRERKKRLIIDIRGFNNITVPDAYPLRLQSHIIFAVCNYTHITVVNCVFFYYQ